MSYKRQFTDNLVMQVSNVPSAPEVARSKNRPVQGYPGCYWYLEMHTKYESYMAEAVIHVSKTPISGSFRLVCKSETKIPTVDFTNTKEFRVKMSIGGYSTTASVTCEAVFSFESPLVPEGWFMRPYELMDDSSRWNTAFVVGEERVNVHRGYLASISPVFEAMFAASTKETETGIVEIMDMDATTVKNAIDFCLGHDVQEKTLEEFLGMHQFVDKYAILPAIARIEKCIAFKTTVDNLSRVIEYAWQNFHINLQAQCARFFKDNSDSLVFHPSIIALPNDIRIAITDAACHFIKELSEETVIDSK